MKDRLISKYKELNTIPIPKRGVLVTVIQDDLFYIVWEENLLKPKVFRYSFASLYHATVFAKAHLENYKYNILEGSILISYGLEYCSTTLRGATDEIQGSLPTKYAFHPQLTPQRKKTLRNLYRRNERRLLRKLLELENTPKNGRTKKDR